MANERVLRSGAERAKRPTNRIPVGKQNRDLLTIKQEDKDPDFEYRIVKDKPGRIDRFLRGGYEIVQQAGLQVGDDTANKVSAEGSPAQIDLGRGEKGYLMRIPKEWYEEDQQAKEQELKSREETMVDTRADGRYGKVEIYKGSQTR